jgi:hypothetical protein
MSHAASATVGGAVRRRPVRTAIDPVTRFRARTRAWIGGGLLICGAITVIGLPYYLAETGVRLRSDLHAWLKPSGWVGQSCGILAFLLFAFLWLYPLRKRVRALQFTGSLARWLDVHIVAGLLAPVFGAVHAGWRFQGIIGLGYGCMLTVSLSGIVGRYLYSHLPRSREGLELGREEVERRIGAMAGQIAEAIGETPDAVRETLRGAFGADRDSSGTFRVITTLLAGDLARWRARRRLRASWAGRPGIDRQTLALAVRLADRHAALTQQTRVVEATRRLFGYWHVAHLPIAVTGLVAVGIHVVAVILLGVTWFG